MIEILLALAACGGFSWLLLSFGDSGYSGFHTLAGVAGLLVGCVAGVASVFALASAFVWTASAHKAEMINAEFGTAYTQEQVFWAGDVIEEIRQVQRQRVELNGNIMQEKR